MLSFFLKRRKNFHKFPSSRDKNQVVDLKIVGVDFISKKRV